MKEFKGMWADKPAQMQLYYLAIMIVAGLSIFSTLGSFIAMGIYDVDFFNNKDLFNDPNTPGLKSALQLMHIFSVIGTFFIPAWLFNFTTQKESLTNVFGGKPKSLYLLLAVAIIVGAAPIAGYLKAWNNTWALPEALSFITNWLEQLEQNSLNIQGILLNMETSSDLWMNIFLMAVLPAIGEELLFRGMLQGHFTKWFNNPHKAIWLTAFLFAVFHQQFHGVLPLFLLGGLLGYLKHWSKNLWPAVLAHFTNNAILVYLAYQGVEANPSALYTITCSIVLVSAGFVFYSKRK
jgi:membrane protease YdiL (CAAX protease family)